MPVRPMPESHYRRLERIYASAPINEYFRPELEISHERAEIVIPLREAFLHAGRAVHGSSIRLEGLPGS